MRVKVVAWVSLVLALLLVLWFLLGYLLDWSDQIWLLLFLSVPLFVASFLLFREGKEEADGMKGGALKNKEGLPPSGS